MEKLAWLVVAYQASRLKKAGCRGWLEWLVNGLIGLRTTREHHQISLLLEKTGTISKSGSAQRKQVQDSSPIHRLEIRHNAGSPARKTV